MHTPKLGQHFLTRPEIARRVATAAHLTPSDTVLEIGPGHGILTRELLKEAGTVVAIEKDPALFLELQSTFSNEIERGALILLVSDVRSFDPSECEYLQDGYILVANIPYYITGAIMRQFLTTQHQPSTMVLLVQKEVAERATAKTGKQSLLSLSVHAYGSPEYVRTVKAGSFSPPPKVDSAVLAVRNISRKHFSTPDEEAAFFELLHAGFAQKRKQLGGNLKALTTDDMFLACNIPRTARAEELGLEAWLCLTKQTKTTTFQSHSV